ncbi:MAG: hypothetical protein JNJ61_09195 [Anaerolineae bacterium]|nr:hypothetical protein [Anaerolineae bacterium]
MVQTVNVLLAWDRRADLQRQPDNRGIVLSLADSRGSTQDHAAPQWSVGSPGYPEFSAAANG